MPDSQFVQFTSEIVAAFVAKNRVEVASLPDLIHAVHRALSGSPIEAVEAASAKRLTPAQVRKSITPDALVSFEDGRPYRMLKRHLGTLGLTPEAYREKWGLPSDYPMVAPAYSAERSAFAKASGLGSKTGARRTARRAAG